MATSPKYRPVSIARYPSERQAPPSSRRYSSRRLIILVAFALLVSSGTMLVFHAVTGSFSPSSSRSTGPGCRKDAEYSIIRWGTNQNNRNSNYRQDPERYNNNNDDNNGAGSPWINDNGHPYNEHERPRQALPKPNDEHDGQPPQQEQQQPIAHETLVQENNRSNNNDSADETAPEEGAAADEEESVEEEEEYSPFEDSLDSSDTTQYLTYLPYAGITNQFYGMLRGMEVAKALGRTLIIPPITASSHDKSKQNQPWSKFLDLDRFQELTGAKVVEFHKLRDVEQTEFNQLQCRITCGFGSKRTIDFTAKGFLKQWKLNVTLSALSVDATKIDTITKVLTPHRRDKYICISNTYKISVPDKSEWERFGQHLHFTQELEDFVQEYLDKNLEKPEAVYDPKTRSTIVPTQKYIAIHARRGDFAQYCQDNFKGPKMIHCLPSTEDFAARIDVIQAKLNPTGSLKGILPVFVATNERRPEELKKFADLGWSYLDHDLMGTVDQLGIFGPMMVDQVFMAHAQSLVGIQMSTFSRVGALRQRDWHNRNMEYL
ncbi:hypothetical protein BGZ95_009094 [Linnemannia exigua]|uniref:GDP-fucose protein O-fucosyltransferase 2 n=1 Tax=Linnemannia exigua TaxID=604196 RepID=A0AAD4DKY7_9FUNG|nr:hypothetical protein BGZ95_009094 [Linnemannia exigua]